MKTIKKHSKVNVELKKQPPVTRPNVGDINWEGSENEKNENEPIVISSETLEDVTEPLKEVVEPEFIKVKAPPRYKDTEIPGENGVIISEDSVILVPEKRETNVTTKTVREVNPDGSVNVITIIETTWPNGQVTSERQTLTVPAEEAAKQAPIHSETSTPLQRQTSIHTRTIHETNPDGSENVVLITDTEWPNGEVTSERKVLSGVHPSDVQKLLQDKPETIIKETSVKRNVTKEISPDGTEKVVIITESTLPNGEVKTEQQTFIGNEIPEEFRNISPSSVNPPQIVVKETSIKSHILKEKNPDGTENIIEITETTQPNGEIKTERKLISGHDTGFDLNEFSKFNPDVTFRESSVKTNRIREMNPDGTENIIEIIETTLPNGEIKTERKVICGIDTGLDFSKLSELSPELIVKETNVRRNRISEINPDGSENIIEIIETTLPNGEIKTERKVISGIDTGIDFNQLSQMGNDVIVRGNSVKTSTIKEINPDGTENVVIITETTLPNGEIKTERKVTSGTDPGDLPTIKGKSVKTNTFREINPDGTETVTVVTETTLPNGEVKTESQTMTRPAGKGHFNSESDNSENQEGIQQKQIINTQTKGRTMESSSGSDVALHEPGAELSDEETGKKTVIKIIITL